jgi:serine/threonine protein phosphatase PrpC
MRDGKMVAQTRDHSRVRLLLEQGVITEAQMANHPERNKVYSCLGGIQAPEIEFSRKTPLEAGDVVLLSTDGFWGPLPPEIVAVSLRQANLLQAVPMLMNQAEARGGQYCDNLSVVAVRWEDSYVESPQSSVSTQTMVLGEVTTKLDEFGRNPAYKLDLTDDEIEKAIQEIRSTIDKFSPKK